MNKERYAGNFCPDLWPVDFQRKFVRSFRAAHDRSRWLAYLSAWLIACSTSALGDDAKFSLEGRLNHEGDQLDIPFRLSSAVFGPGPLAFRTWSHAGGTNHAGDAIPSGGFDPTLALRNSTGTQIAFTDDGTGVPSNFDSLLSFTAGDSPVPSPLSAGDYTLRIAPQGGHIGTFQTKNWAVDLTGSDNVLSLNFGAIDLVSGSPGISKVSVIGVGSTWTNSSDLYVGNSGNGSLNIQAGGKVTNTVGRIGHNAGSTGTATVTGANSMWTNSSDLFVGRRGSGTLNIEAGGMVNNTLGWIGVFAGSTSTATVTGPNSTWTNSGQFTVAQGATARSTSKREER